MICRASIAVAFSTLLGSSVTGTSLKVMSGSLALLGALVASGVWWVSSPRLVKGVKGVLEPVRSWDPGTRGTETLTHSPTPRFLYSQRTWGDFTLSLGRGANVVGVSWVGVTGSPRADLEKEEAASIV